MFYAKKMGLSPGDQIVEYITALGIAKHFAIYLGWDDAGTEWVIENIKGDAVRVTKANDFFSRVIKVDRIIKHTGTNWDRKNLVQRALSKIGVPYNLINYNCEHFVTEVITGKPVSRQVQNAVAVYLSLFVFALLIND